MADIRITVPGAPGANTRASRLQLRGMAGTPEGAGFFADYIHYLSREGRVFFAHPGAAQNTTFAGAALTSFAATTPDWTLEVPSGTTCIPLYISQQQAGTVAGGAISYVLAMQNAAERSSGGTAFANILSTRTDGNGITHACTPYAAPTVSSDTVGVRLMSTILTQSVTTGRTGPLTNDIFIQAGVDIPMLYLVGPAALKSYAWAGTTAPTWLLSLCWAEIPSSDLTS